MLPLFPTTVVGSMPRPQYVKDLLAAAPRTGVDAAWQRRMDDAVRYVIGMQEQAGIDIVSDGEWRRESYVDIIGEVMHGFRWVQREVFAYHQVIAAPMTPRRPGAVAAEAAFLKANTQRAVKVCLPSPYLLGQRMWEPQHSVEASAKRWCRSCAPSCRRCAPSASMSSSSTSRTCACWSIPK
jgi:5-methyltetrahydropteroyltriglutamate--homocysteine methyltransferase